MLDERLTNAQILIVDDQDANVLLLEEILKQAGYTRLVATTDARRVFPLFVDCQPDLLLLDLHMPYLDGFEVLDRLRRLTDGGTYLPILVLTADVTREAKQRALSMGAKDFLTKPFDASEVLLRIRNMLETRFLHLQLRDQNLALEGKVRERTRELHEAHVATLRRLAKAAEYRDDVTGKHTERVGELARQLAVTLGFPEGEIEVVGMAAPLHDVGKIGIPDGILLKPAALTAVEFEIMKSHTTIGASILSGSDVRLLQLAEEIALTHHERWDGRGYPRGLAGEQIPIAGRVVAVADAYDVMTTDRPYRRALSLDRARQILDAESGRQWDPQVVSAFEATMARQLASGRS